MKMIIGGAFQGKTLLAKKTYPDLVWINGSEADWKIIASAQAGNDVSELAERLIQLNPDVILVSDEVGYGVVPMDAFDRAYREAVGRVCTKLAAYSSQVTRVVCGIGTVIKDA